MILAFGDASISVLEPSGKNQLHHVCMGRSLPHWFRLYTMIGTPDSSAQACSSNSNPKCYKSRNRDFNRDSSIRETLTHLKP